MDNVISWSIAEHKALITATVIDCDDVIPIPVA